MDQSLIAFLFLLASVLLARLLNTQGIEGLNSDQKGELLQDFTRFRMLAFFVFLTMALLATGLFIWWEMGAEVWIASCTVLFIVYLLVLVVLSYKRLQKRRFPASYLRNYLWSSFIRISGVLIFIFLLMGKYWKQS